MKFPLDTGLKSAIFNDVDENAAPDQPPSTPDIAVTLDARRSLPGIRASVRPAAPRDRVLAQALVGHARGGALRPQRPALLLRHAHGVGRPNARANAGGERWLVPRQRVAASANSATFGSRSPLRVRLPDPTAAGCAPARRSGGRCPGRCRSARLGRGLPSRRGLDRTRRDLWTSLRGRSSAARGHAAFPRCGPHQRLGRALASLLLVRDEGGAHRGKAARELSLVRRGMGGARRAG